MADFKKSFLIVMGHEGGYVNDSIDRGGETYKGIARNANAAWKGWRIIDGYKSFADFKAKLDADPGLQNLVLALYKMNYWDALRLDEITNQDIATEMFDISVNMGPTAAAYFLQRSLNLLNRNQKDFADIKADGRIGTLSINTANNFQNIKALLKTINGYQFERYKEICESDPSQERFFIGWLNRV